MYTKRASLVILIVSIVVLAAGSTPTRADMTEAPLPKGAPQSEGPTIPLALYDAETRVVTNGVGYLTIPAAAFTPYQDGYDYENHGRYLVHKGGPEGWYFAPMHLPHGATVLQMTFYWYDLTPVQQAKAKLQRTELGKGDYLEMAYADSGIGGTNYGSRYDDTITYATIDNTKYAYWATLDLPATASIRGCSIVVEYIPPTTVTGRLSIPAAAFKPYEDGYDYENHARHLVHKAGGTSNRGWYLAPVYLPHGATVTKVTFHWYDTWTLATAQVIARLQRTEFGKGNFQEMAHAESTGWAGYGSSADGTISYNNVDNSRYAYWVIWDLPASSGAVKGCGVVIDYTVPTASALSGYISVPAAAFTPYADEWDYQNHGRYLKHLGGATRAHYEAAVYLPQWVPVTKVTFHYRDDWSGEVGHARLVRFDLTNADNYPSMATISSPSGAPGWSTRSDTSISVPMVDNSKYGYWVYWDLPISTGTGHDIWGCGMVIEYGHRIYLPLTLRKHH